MIVWLLVPLVAVGLALVAAAVVVRRRRTAREALRARALGRLAEQLDVSLSGLRAPRSPPVAQTKQAGGAAPLAEGLSGRAALLEAVAADVDQADRAGAQRLTVAVVRLAGKSSASVLYDAVRDATGRPAYAVGPSAAAFTLPGLGRAEGLGALARIESAMPSTGRAVEWKPGETAAELVARLLAAPGGDG
jgi:hypothetical protein